MSVVSWETLDIENGNLQVKAVLKGPSYWENEMQRRHNISVWCQKNLSKIQILNKITKEERLWTIWLAA